MPGMRAFLQERASALQSMTGGRRVGMKKTAEILHMSMGMLIRLEWGRQSPRAIAKEIESLIRGLATPEPPRASAARLAGAAATKPIATKKAPADTLAGLRDRIRHEPDPAKRGELARQARALREG
jgi:hypothetical protein